MEEKINNDSKVNRNMLLNMAKTILSVIFPLITYPYATRILGPENFGKVSFCLSIMGYISLIATLGISNYAIREGGFYRKRQSDINQFSSEIFTISIISTIAAYIILFLLLIFSVKLQNYVMILLIQSLSVIFVTIGTDWVNMIFEDYLYITVRSLIVQIVMLVSLFAFVRSSDDYLQYAGITVLGNGIVSMLNFCYVKKYVKVKIVKFNIKKHLNSILILFSNNIAVSIYCNSDITMIGYFLSDSQVGLYSLASKIYMVIKQIIAAAYSVSVTRMTEYIGIKNKIAFIGLLNDIINNIILIAIPVIVGGVVYSDNIIVILAGDEFLDASTPFIILIFTILPAVLGGMLAYCINLPLKKEVVNLRCTSISAVENIILNAIMIPNFGIVGSAFATFVSEFTVFALLLYSLKSNLQIFNLRRILFNVVKCGVSCIPIIILKYIFPQEKSLALFSAIVIVSITLYFVVNVMIKNENLKNLINSIVNKRFLIT